MLSLVLFWNLEMQRNSIYPSGESTALKFEDSSMTIGSQLYGEDRQRKKKVQVPEVYQSPLR